MPKLNVLNINGQNVEKIKYYYLVVLYFRS